MKSFKQYLEESAATFDQPAVGDDFAINVREECLLETYVVEETDDGIVLHADEGMMSLLEHYGFLEAVEEAMNEIAYQPTMEVEQPAASHAVKEDYKNPVASAVLHRIMMQHPGVLATHGPERVMQAVDELADWVGDVDEIGSSDVSGWTRDVIRALAELPDEPMDVGDRLDEFDMEEAKYQGREVPLGKPMAGDVKKSKVYVRGPKGNVVKVNFGDKTMKIKKSNPARRKSFRARHNCDNPGPRWKARYWSCRAW
jgi:hypothetical protein